MRKPSVLFVLAASTSALVLLVAATPRAVRNENIRAIVSDRALAAYHLLLLARHFSDRDGDGFARPPFGYDCDDADPNRHPMAYDLPGDGLDQDCTGSDRRPPTALPPLPAAPSASKAASSSATKASLDHDLILMVTMDSVRADRWPAFYRRNIMPNLYRLGRSCAYFTRAYAVSNWTVPSVHSLLTGLYPSHFRFVKAAMTKDDKVLIIDPKSPYARNPKNMRRLIPVPATDRTRTLAQELASRGYVTATVVGIPFLRPEVGMTRGFLQVDQGPYIESNRSLKGASARQMTEAALRMIRRSTQGAPRKKLFLYLHYNDTHAPYRRRHLGSSPLDRYDSEILYTDFWLGRLLAELSRTGLLRRTIFMATADHGEEFRDHGGLFHASTVYEEQVHVPLLMCGPGLRSGVHDHVVSHVDLFPTLLSLSDLATGRVTVAGRDLRAGRDLSDLLLTGRAAEGLKTRFVYAESRRFLNYRQSVIGRRYKLIRDNKAGTTVLYDLEDDPKETRNLVTARPDVTRKLLKIMFGMLDSG